MIHFISLWFLILLRFLSFIDEVQCNYDVMATAVLITVAERNCGCTSLLLERNDLQQWPPRLLL
jgi:hypothetical protein